MIRKTLALYWDIFNPPAPLWVAKWLPWMTHNRKNPWSR